MTDPSLDPMLPPRPIGESSDEPEAARLHGGETTLESLAETRILHDTAEEKEAESPRTVDIGLEPMLPPRPPVESPERPAVRPQVAPPIELEPLVLPHRSRETSLEALNAESDEERHHGDEGTSWLAPFLLMLCLAAFHVIANLWWLHQDNHPIRTDEEGHMLFARQYHEVLFVRDYPDPVRRLIAVSQIRPGIPAHPPLFQLLGALMIEIFGYSPDTIAATSTVMFVLLLFGCYALARTFLLPWQSLFAVFVVSMTPIVFASSRFFMTDFGSAVIAVWSIFALVKSQGLRHPGWVLLFAVLSGLGILTRTVTFAYFLVPAILTGLAGIAATLRREPWEPGWGTLAVNVAMALVVTVGIFAPWYCANLEPFYDYWSNKEISGTRGPLTNFAPPPPVNAANAAPDAPPTLMADQSTYARIVRTVSEKAANPPVAWIRYPVYLVNDGLFAVLAGLALLGMLIAPLRAQFRAFPLACFYFWILGSWGFFSVIIRSATPRYGLPVAPALALFAALAILALPGRWIRMTAAALLSVVLLFQYALLTIQPMGPKARLDIPVTFPQDKAHYFADPGLVVFKDNLALGFSYARLGAPEKENYQERLILAMLKHEKELPVRTGQFANYQKLNARGLEFYERHYWPGDNPYRLPSLAPADVPERRLTMIHMGTEPEQLLPRLGETDYIIFEAPAAKQEIATGYQAFFESRGYSLIESFDVPEFGWVPAARYGVLARKLQGDLVPVTAESIAAMDLYDIHALKYSADFQRLSPELRDLAQRTFTNKLQAVATPFQLNEAVTFMAADTTRVDTTTYRVRMVFQVDKALDRNWRMLFHGFVSPENLSKLPADKQAQGYMDWNFDPQPPATEWVPGDFVILTNQIVAEPLQWQFKFGLFQGDVLFGRTGLLKVMDLGAM
ncbi:MAG: glycosyltransferase family 39 protein [Candidatus Hydrogenedentes bacterium]|nr:glycosyltransferase family 39 protein [Candidatus Hydrogenedentota bacterium]